jgi:NAD(P)-dependent dehydrogenase (short-subunit alcohol dehydrogenase family)
VEDFKGKVAVITGAASGIGLALAERAATLGMRLLVTDIDDEKLQDTLPGLNDLGAREVLAVACDVANESQVKALAARCIDRFGAVHLLVNNAGVGGGGCLWELDSDYWNWILGINLYGVIHGVRHFTPLMIAQGEGHVVNTASIAGLMSAPGTGPYTVSKHAVVALSEMLYGELRNANANVGVSLLCPSFVDTRIFASERNRPMDEAMRKDSRRIAEQEAIEEAAAAFFGSTAIDPARVAGAVFDAIREQRFYILTHPEGSKEQIEKRMRAILDDGVPGATGPENFPLA